MWSEKILLRNLLIFYPSRISMLFQYFMSILAKFNTFSKSWESIFKFSTFNTAVGRCIFIRCTCDFKNLNHRTTSLNYITLITWQCVKHNRVKWNSKRYKRWKSKLNGKTWANFLGSCIVATGKRFHAESKRSAWLEIKPLFFVSFKGIHSILRTFIGQTMNHCKT